MSSRYAKKSEQAAEAPAQPRGHKCSAYGCPLAGTNTDSLKGSDQWYCRFHNGRDVSEFDAISTRVNRHRALIEHARLVQRLGPVIMVTQPEKFQTGNALHRKQPGESFVQYVNRLNGLIFDAVHNGPTTTSEAA